MVFIPLQIAIDGPVAAGKGDIAARLAKEFHLVYINTGAMYRALAYACIKRKVDTKDYQKVIDVLKQVTITLEEPEKNSNKTFCVQLNGKDITEEIYTPEVMMGSSDVATIPEVRKIMVELQQKMVVGKRVVMEGRDIGLRVLPQAQLKIFLTASPEERARRRQIQWQEKGINKSYTESLKDTKLRDLQDTTRTIDPLQKIAGAWELDTTQKTQDQVVLSIKQELVRRGLL